MVTGDFPLEQAFFADELNGYAVTLDWDDDSGDSVSHRFQARQESSYYAVYAPASGIHRPPATRITSLPGNRGPPTIG